jgi:transposase, IS6 family
MIFLLLDRRNANAAHRFLGKALKTMPNWPHSTTIDKLGFLSQDHPPAAGRRQGFLLHATAEISICFG